MVPVKSRYRKAIVKIPKPVFFVFYNGEEQTQKEFIQKLSDSYIDSDDNSNVSLELKVKVININIKAEHEILERCQVLKEYSQFVEAVRKYRKDGYEDYMKKAITYCIEHHILEEYLLRKGSDVLNFLCAEYDYEMDLQVKGEESYEKGYKNGLRNGIDAIIVDNISQGISKEEITEKLMKYFSMTEKEAKDAIEKYLEEKETKLK